MFLTLSITAGAYALVKADKFDIVMLLVLVFIILLGAYFIWGTYTVYRDEIKKLRDELGKKDYE